MDRIARPDSCAPFLRSTEEQASKVCRQLEGVYRELSLLRDLLQVCSDAGSAEGMDGRKIEHVLRRCGADRLPPIQRTVRSLIERFGGVPETFEQRKGDIP